MNNVIFEAVAFASSGLFSIGSITITILLLISDQGWKKGLGYALGYMTGYISIGLSLVISQHQFSINSSNSGSKILYIFMIIFGMILLLLSLKLSRSPIKESKSENKLFSLLDKITPIKAVGLGLLVSIINFKNLALFLTSISILILSDLTISAKIYSTFLIVLVFCASILTPVIIYMIFPKKGDQLMENIKTGINKHKRTILIWVPTIFGIVFIMKGFSELI